MNSKPKVIAHRGASGHAPETTLAAYQLALQMGVDGIEMDVHRLCDGTIVAIHDANVERTTNGKASIVELTLPELKALDAGGWFNKAFPQKARPEYAGLKVPTLQEIIDLVKASAVELYIEIKDPERYAPDLESALLSVIKNNRLESRTNFISFNAASIARMKALDSAIRTGLLISELRGDPVRAAMEISANEIGLRYTLAAQPIVDAAHRNGLAISVWTIDSQADMRRMLQLGVDGITSNYPDRLIRLLESASTLRPS